MSIFFEANNNTEFDSIGMFMVDKDKAIEQEMKIKKLETENQKLRREKNEVLEEYKQMLDNVIKLLKEVER